MPELPEVETVRRTLEPFLLGRRIAHVEVHWPRTVDSTDPAAFAAAVVGQRIGAVDRRAKYLLLRLESGSVVAIHLRMTGELRFRPRPAPIDIEGVDRHLRLRLAFDDDGDLLFYDTRKFGRFVLLDSSALSDLDGRLGIEPLDASFTVSALSDILARRSRQIKPLLLDQSVIAGLGNIYVDEALFRAGIHPRTPSSSIDLDRCAKLHAAIVDVLSTAIAHNGTTLRDYRTGLGDQGANQDRLRVYGSRPGTPCPICGTPLERLIVGQRGSIFCPSCQPQPSAPTLIEHQR